MEPDEPMDIQSPEEVAAQAGAGSVGQFVLAWLNTILEERDWATAMRHSTPELRLARAQAWVFKAQSTGEVAGFSVHRVADELAAANEEHPLWSTFADAELRGFDQAWGDVREHLAIGTRPRPLDPDHEVVVVADYRTVPSQELDHGGFEGKLVTRADIRAWPMVVRHQGGQYLMASHNGPERMPQPGWPPTL